MLFRGVKPLKIDVLGAKYDLRTVPKGKDPYLEDCDGYCDYTTKQIVVIDYKSGKVGEIKNDSFYVKQIKRHEIIHAFFFESGLGANWEHKPFGQEETTVDWIARQFPKMLEAFKAADAL